MHGVWCLRNVKQTTSIIWLKFKLGDYCLGEITKNKNTTGYAFNFLASFAAQRSDTN